jgi:hypothetical protein
MERFWGAVAQLRAAPDAAQLRTVVVAIAVVQAGVLGILARRGSWLSDDLEFLVQGSRGFAPHELLTPLNDHIAPGLRFVYAMFAKLAPLNHDVTVAWRVVLQALAITLMGLLLLRLLGSSRWVVSGTLLYALTPLSMPSFMSLSSGVNNLPAHVFGLLVLHATLDWYAGRRGRAVAYGPLCLLVSLAFWEKSALILLTVIAIALYLGDRPLRRWSRQSWPFALCMAAPVVAFGILYAVHRQPSSGRFPEPGELVDLAGRSFAVPLAALVGGPWKWDAISPPFGMAAAPAGAVIFGAIVAAFLLTVAWRVDRRALLLWGAICAYVLITLLLVAYGRFELFGASFTIHYHYWSDLSIPLTLAFVLTARLIRGEDLTRWAPAVASCCLLAWTTGAVVSDVGFARLWGENPARPYFMTLTAELDRAGPSVNVWDTPMPSNIMTVLVADRRLSPVLRMAKIPVTVQGPGSEPYLVDSTGRLRPSTFTASSYAVPPRTGDNFCELLMHGADSVTLPLRSTLNQPLTESASFARIGYWSNRETRLLVELVDESGRAVSMSAPDAAWPAGLATMYFGPAQHLRADAVRIRSTDPATNVCVGKIEIGLPQVSG